MKNVTKKEISKKYPKSLFDKGIIDLRANDGLTAVENENLSKTGLIRKMNEFQDQDGGVDAYIYDITVQDLKRLGGNMPKNIRKIQYA